MGPTQQTLRAMLEQSMGQYRAHAPWLCQIEGFEHGLKSWLKIQSTRIYSESFGDALRRAYPVRGNAPLAYRHRVVDCEDGLSILGGIRFRGGTFPFVDILATTADIEDAAAVWSRLKEHWASFEPVGFRMLRSRPLDTRTLHVCPDQHLVAGPLARLGATATHHRPDVHLKSATPESALPIIERAYASLPAKLTGRVFPASRLELGRCAHEGMLATIEHDGSAVGVIAADRHHTLGLPGYRIVEMVILPEYRGQGYAQRAQTALACAFVHEHEHTMLYGWIDADNPASLGAAKRCGRTILSTLWWCIEPDKLSPGIRRLM
ncbi:MAG: GNAT family N-acetyltransferase [Myxococcota bacterium]|nr:GNAT family N-acetyltransferase [Myxococcota bacterium]